MFSVSARAVSKVSTSTLPGPKALSAGSGWRNAAYAAARDGAGHADGCGDAARGPEQPGPEAPGGAERDDGRRGAVGGRELGREVEDAADLGTAEAVDRLVGVADHRQVAAVAGERPKQGDLGGVGVLVLVHEDVAEPGPELVAVEVGLDDSAGDQVGVVDGGLVAEDVEVLTQEEAGRLELRHLLRPAERDQVVGVEAALAGAGQHRVDLAREASGAHGRAQLLGPGD